MSEITLDFRSVTSEPISRLEKVAGQVDHGGQLRIIVERTDTEIAREMFSFLEREGFQVSSKGAHGDDGFNIIARRINRQR
ncbi:MAG: hypothetical protein UMV23_01790 [Halanaerobium sp.]|nr:hypothetical protein [Halanaerobium sp.]